jgi:hypothetical protein
MNSSVPVARSIARRDVGDLLQHLAVLHAREQRAIDVLQLRQLVVSAAHVLEHQSVLDHHAHVVREPREQKRVVLLDRFAAIEIVGDDDPERALATLDRDDHELARPERGRERLGPLLRPVFMDVEAAGGGGGSARQQAHFGLERQGELADAVGQRSQHRLDFGVFDRMAQDLVERRAFLLDRVPDRRGFFTARRPDGDGAAQLALLFVDEQHEGAIETDRFPGRDAGQECAQHLAQLDRRKRDVETLEEQRQIGDAALERGVREQRPRQLDEIGEAPDQETSGAVEQFVAWGAGCRHRPESERQAGVLRQPQRQPEARPGATHRVALGGRVVGPLERQQP